jgi:hypothetical protein
VLLCGLAAIALAACGGSVDVHPVAPAGSTKLVSRGRVDDARTMRSNHLACLRKDHLPAQEVGPTGIQIGTLPAGPTVVFAPTPGIAQGQQIQGTEQGAEVIGSALLYPNQASDSELSKIESCLSLGVSG